MALISYLQVDSLTKSYGDKILFEDVTFGVNQGDKIGLIAKNGSGKTTMLRIIAGLEDKDSGTVTYRSDLRVAYLDQKPQFADDDTPLSLCSGLAPVNDIDASWNEDDREKQILTQLGITDFLAPVSTLSGGQQKRIALARIVLQKPELIILDEPTNHLDIGVIEWLENWLKKSKITLLMVTHDRYFLDRVCNKILEIDMHKVFSYDGNFEYYLRKRQERIDALTGELAKVKNTLRKEQDWMNRQPQARAGKAKFRIDAFHDLKKRSQVNYEERNIAIDVKSSYIGSKIFEAEGINKRYGDKVIVDDFNYTFARYDKVGIVGENGVGKSTFIKMLQGLVPQDSGEWNVGETVRFGYYSQNGIEFDNNKKVIDAITEIADDIVINNNQHYSPMQFLQRFLFSPADQQKYIHTLSGGERCRLHLATVFMRSPNFLILDEPTNDLDIVTLGLLEEYLAEFKGCAIIVSHDRFFLDSIVDHLFVFTGNGVIKDFPGNYSEFREWQTKMLKEAQGAGIAVKPNEQISRKPSDRPRKLSFKEKKMMEALEAELDSLNTEKVQLEALFASGTVIDGIDDKSQRYIEIKELIDEKELQWLELSEIGY